MTPSRSDRPSQLPTRQHNLTLLASWCDQKEVEWRHTFVRNRLCESRPSEFPEKDGNSISKLHPGNMNAQTCSGACAKWVEYGTSLC